MTVAATRHIAGMPVEPHVRRALEDLGDASLTELAAAAWSAQHQHEAAGATNRLEQTFKKMFGRVFDVVSPERHDRANPAECVGGQCDELWFSWRGNKLSYIVECAHKDCKQELYGPVNGVAELGRVLSLIEDEKGELTEWKCQAHRKGGVV